MYYYCLLEQQAARRATQSTAPCAAFGAVAASAAGSGLDAQIYSDQRSDDGGAEGVLVVLVMVVRVRRCTWDGRETISPEAN